MIAVTPTIGGSSVIGSQRSIWGTLAVTSTGGAFSTGLKYVNSINITGNDALDSGGARVQLNTSSNGDVTLTVASGEFTASNFMAIGYGGG